MKDDSNSETNDTVLEPVGGPGVEHMANGWFKPEISVGSILTLSGTLVAVAMGYQSLRSEQDHAVKEIERNSSRISATSAADTRRVNGLAVRISGLESKLAALVAALEEREKSRVSRQEFRELRSAIMNLKAYENAR